MEQIYLTEDTIRCKLLIDLARNQFVQNPEKSLHYIDKAILLAQKIDAKRLLSNAYSAKATLYLYSRNFATSLSYFENALSINEKINYQQGIANNYNNIGLIYQSTFNYPKALEYFLQALTINEKTGNQVAIINALGNIGNIYNDLADFKKAIEYYDKAINLLENNKNQKALPGLLNNLGNVYTQIGDNEKALSYKLQALEISKNIDDPSLIANNLGNLANVYKQLGNYDKAIIDHNKSLAIYTKLNDQKGMASAFSGLADVQILQKNYSAAIYNVMEALTISKAYEILTVESSSFKNLSKIFSETGKHDSAFYYYQKHIEIQQNIDNADVQKQITKTALQFEFSKTEDSLHQQQILTDIKLNQQILIAEKQEQEIKIKENSIALANKQKEVQKLQFLKSEADLLVSQSQNKIKEEQLVTIEKEKKLQESKVNLQKVEISLQNEELKSQKEQRIYLFIGIGLLTILSFSFYKNFINQKQSKQNIEVEKEKSDLLLHNILPHEVAQELKEKGETTAKRYNEVTVLFTDFVDFTATAEKLTPEALVQELHECFKAFDGIIANNGMEKIKTIGDAYMAAAGIPVEDKLHAIKAANSSLEIIHFMENRRNSKPSTFRIRIGLHSGPVVAGVVGVRKFAYDIWGDTVNTASRMETASEPGKINLSSTTGNLLDTHYKLNYRGKLAAKNKGEIEMYFLEGKV